MHMVQQLSALLAAAGAPEFDDASHAAEWAASVKLAMEAQPAPVDRPRIVCLCGSTRFMEAFRAANLRETIAGRIVLSIGCDTKSDSDLLALGELTPESKAALDALHKRKIDMADDILVLNVGGYIGQSTRSEIDHAIARGKGVRYLEPDECHRCAGEPASDLPNWVGTKQVSGPRDTEGYRCRGETCCGGSGHDPCACRTHPHPER